MIRAQSLVVLCRVIRHTPDLHTRILVCRPAVGTEDNPSRVQHHVLANPAKRGEAEARQYLFPDLLRHHVGVQEGGLSQPRLVEDVEILAVRYPHRPGERGGETAIQ